MDRQYPFFMPVHARCGLQLCPALAAALHLVVDAGGSLPFKRLGNGRRPARVCHGAGHDRQAAEGWRLEKARGGLVLHVASGNTITDGMAMPHSPRVHGKELYVLNSGEGALEVVDPNTGQRDTIARLPGYTRGLAIADRWAFVGLSKIREKREFGGLPIEDSIKQLTCGIACVDIERGQLVELIEFQSGCEEIFDVQFLGGTRFPAVVGLQKDTINGVFVVPSEMGV